MMIVSKIRSEAPMELIGEEEEDLLEVIFSLSSELPNE